ncbi:sugar kinase [Palleronia sp. LCG004]|uniref:sugar kinase n=1 Tax=Palleronia sp. LCG004 TaxID=3079304 RepID=UPI00294218D3|nr:sugar kinase [Palleronia sp. LCG004]WOI55377.1 sugar kinase [Palleronia sp. LCG004]
MTSERSFLSIGECMVELAQTGSDTYRRGFAGDTFNTAWYARRLLPDEWRVSYGSCIGTDAVSEEMAAFMEAEGIDTTTLRRVPDRSVGLYMISTEGGERSFSYWRSQSAARLLADDSGWLDEVLGSRDYVHLSGITLAILPAAQRSNLCNALKRAREGGTFVSFDTNLRPRLWEDEKTMREGLTMGAEAADLVLPSFDEETGLFGDPTPADTVARYRAGGARMVVVKNGGEDVTLWSADGTDTALSPERVADPVDTTAAGDSFAAAVLAGLATGKSLEDAVAVAMILSAKVIRSHGALAPAIFD